jgi:hypothetical protein
MDSTQTTELPPSAVAARPLNTGHLWTVCRYLLGAVLITAAVLKAYELATLPLLGAGLLNQRWLLVAAVEVEVVFGGWLLIGPGGRWTWVTTWILWLAFLGIAGYEAVTGAGSCGCFGRVHVNPWYTASFDLAVLVALPFCRPSVLPVKFATPRSIASVSAVASYRSSKWGELRGQDTRSSRLKRSSELDRIELGGGPGFSATSSPPQDFGRVDLAGPRLPVELAVQRCGGSPSACSPSLARALAAGTCTATALPGSAVTG